MRAPVTIELEEQTLSALDALAARIDRPRSVLVNEALENWLAIQKWQLEQIEAGIAEADRGEFVSDEEIARIVAGHDVA